MTIEVEQGFTAEQTRHEVERCLNCDVQTHFTDSLCIECDACIDICPMDCLTITPNGDEPELRDAPDGAGGRTSSRRCSSPDALKQTGRVMVKDENVCLHCGLCAERCPTYAWDMRKFVLQHAVRRGDLYSAEAVGRLAARPRRLPTATEFL